MDHKTASLSNRSLSIYGFLSTKAIKTLGRSKKIGSVGSLETDKFFGLKCNEEGQTKAGYNSDVTERQDKKIDRVKTQSTPHPPPRSRLNVRWDLP